MKKVKDPPGDGVIRKARATLSDVAERAGVSPVTVSRAIRHPEMVSPTLRKRVGDAVSSLHYIPNQLASALASTRTNIVGVTVPSLTNGVFDDFLASVQEVLERAGVQMLVSNTRYSEEEEDKAIETMLGYHPEAMIVIGVDQSERAKQMLLESGIPIVQAMDMTDEPLDLNVGFDHRAAAVAAVRHLYELGHRTIGHLTVSTDPRSARRREGYVAAMADLGLPTQGLIAASKRSTSVGLGGQLFAEVLGQRPDVTAVFACNDDLALGMLFECQRRSIRVPDDVAIVGFNDLGFSNYSMPPLTTVSTERRRIGSWAAQSILEIIRGSGNRPLQRRIDMGFTIEKRGSTATPSHSPAAARKPVSA
jgi:LacI family transcriptional regulator, gluconate utilization system Gnt-I transcriptional repressor